MPLVRWNCFFLVATALASTSAVSAQTVNFTNIADTNGGFLQFTRPTISNSGVVAFTATTSANRRGVFAASGGNVTTIADDQATFSSFQTSLSINGTGTVAFIGALSEGGSGIYTGSGGALTTIVTTGNTFSNFSRVSLNDSGTIAFDGGFRSGESAIFTQAGTTVTAIADTFGSYRRFFATQINSSNTVLFGASLDNDMRGIYTSANGVVTTIADTSGMTSDDFGLFSSSEPDGDRPVINSSGTIAFSATLRSGREGIFSVADGITTTVIDDTSSFDSFFGPSINAGGTVVFSAGLDNGGRGLFAVRPGQSAPIPIVQQGDALFGSTVTRLLYSGSALSDSDQVAFQYVLANGQTGIAVASVVTPEASSLALLAPVFGLGSMVAVRRRLRGVAKSGTLMA